MNMIFAVALGGALGATGRFLVGKAMLRIMGPGFPWGTLSVNIIGSFAIGLIVTLLASRYNLSHSWQGFLITGILGGFTTFSAFSLEVGLMVERHEITQAALYGLGSLFFGVAALFMGLYAGRYLA
ncbi:fluoride efflux transporter CrcB [Paremcibacter congregatus]|uniref:Fluoride-specific ion channel FluC n=1 Tax=Paremcibacter congregatus TaxID=2043170 RepID=A0A2G4YTM9_9PROT|nr:fluoride efflux transporter CrcB [Paremcibacter congregatus]PHZ85647.1 fluoride efflux transporter CrcB [Paremcibacter congregatus]QDE26607.1 fluoride efflux transporter CrcB [Paremcibacter congregatus]